MKNFRFLTSILLFSIAVVTFQSCSDSDSTPTASFINVYDNSGDLLDNISVPLSASRRMIGIRSDATWTAQSDADWCTISNHEGYGYGTDSTFYIRVDIAKNEGMRRTANITFTSGSMTKVVAVTQKGSDMDPGDPFESSYKVVENIRLGYNLGNTLESDPDQTNEASSWWKPTSDLSWETVWGQPKTTQAIIDSIAAKGFNIIRVPVTWWPHMDENWQVKEIWMNRVKEVVDMVMNANCYCIINVMHDTGARNGRTDGGGWLSANPDEFDASSVKYESLWKQIATEFKDYDQRLLFESFNEILDGNDTWDDPSNTACYTTINKLQQIFVNTVRATGGNNEYRNLIVTTYSAGHTQAKLNGFEVPDDLHPNHLLASIHSYDPYNFCNENKGDGYDYNIYVWDSSCEQEIDNLTAMIDNRFNTLGIPYIYGEFGAIDENKDMGERVKYAKYMAAKMKSYNTTGLWWMGLYNRKKKKWYESEIVDALFNVMGVTTTITNQ